MEMVSKQSFHLWKWLASSPQESSPPRLWKWLASSPPRLWKWLASSSQKAVLPFMEMVSKQFFPLMETVTPQLHPFMETVRFEVESPRGKLTPDAATILSQLARQVQKSKNRFSRPGSHLRDFGKLRRQNFTAIP